MRTNHQVYRVMLGLILFISPGITSAQAPTKLWDARFGGSKLDIVDGVLKTSDNGFMLVGVSASNNDGNKTQIGQGYYDYWVTKTNANGVKEWDRTFGGTDDDGAYDIQQTSDGNYLVSGYSSSGANGDKSEESKGNKDFWIIKISPAGNKIWDHVYGGNRGEVLRSALVTSDGGFLLAGYSFSGISYDKTQANNGSSGTSDYWIIKLDADGVKEWDRSFGGDGQDELTAMVEIPTGGYMLAGSSNSSLSGDLSQASKGLNDFWIVQIDAAGNKQWDARYGGSQDDYLIALTTTSDGGFVLTGYSFSPISGDKTQDCWGNSDVWTVKIDADGVKQWDARFGASKMDRSRSVIQTTDGGYFIGAYTNSDYEGDISEASRGVYDFWVLKLDANGGKEWDKRYGGEEDDHCHLVMQLSETEYMVVGHSMSQAGGDKTQSCFGSDDFWMLKLGEVVLLPIELSDFDLQPENGGVRIDWTTLSEYDVSHFTVQRSLDAENFDSIGMVQGAGLSSLGHSYSLFDAHPPKQLLYYRLKQTENNGTVDYSDIRAVNLQPVLSYSVFPNPAADYLVFESSASVNTDAVVEIHNALGRVVLNKRIPGSMLRQEISLDELTPGYYTVSIKNAGQTSAYIRLLVH
jgi:hypothetical protein